MANAMYNTLAGRGFETAELYLLLYFSENSSKFDPLYISQLQTYLLGHWKYSCNEREF